MGYIENCQKAPTFLEKDGETKKFLSQSEVDQAWAEGWYAPGRPESAETQKIPEQENPEKQEKSKRGRLKKDKK